MSEPSLLLAWVEALGPAVVAGIAAYTAVKVENAVLKQRMGSVEERLDLINATLLSLSDTKTRMELQGARIDEVTKSVHELGRRFIDYIMERERDGAKRSGQNSRS